MVFLSEKETGFLESLAVEGVSVLEDLADALNLDMLGQDLLTSLLEGRHVEPISQL